MNFTCVADPDTTRRDAYMRAVRANLMLIPSLTVGEAQCNDFHACWATAEAMAPGVCQDSQHIALVWGRPVPKDGADPVAPAGVAAAWSTIDTAVPSAWDGYFAAVTFSATHGIVAGVDVLGVVPLFWWNTGEVTLVGTSPSPFRHHPLFQVRLDRLGLAGMLLTSFSVSGRTLLEGVRRLGQGSLLHAAPGRAPREIVQYRPALSTVYFDLPIVEHVNVFEEAIDNAIRRHVPAEIPHTLLLSGGMDSRIVAGFLARHNVPTNALTFGMERDIELYCARSVAKALKLEHRVEAAEMSDGIACAERHVQLLHGTSSMLGINYWNALNAFRELPPQWTGGYSMDAILAAQYGRRAYSKTHRSVSFDEFQSYLFRFGVGPDRLRTMLRFDDANDIVDQLVSELRSTYECLHELESRRYWCFTLGHRHRFHIGQMPYIMSFAARPALITCDQNLLDTAAGMATISLDERLAEKRLLIDRFPDLARLPLDRNNRNCTPIIPSWKDLLRQRIEVSLRSYPGRLRSATPTRSQYHRAFDFNGGGWRQARKHAEPFRSRWLDILDMGVLNAYMPPPEAELETTDIFADTSGRKLLLGLFLWGRDYL